MRAVWNAPAEKRKASRQNKVAAIWDRVVPAESARHARAIRLRAGVLWVEVDSSARLHEMKNFPDANLAKRINENLGEPLVARIEFRLRGERAGERDGG